MAPIFAHLYVNDGVSMSGVSGKELDQVLDDAAIKIPVVIPSIYTYWKARRIVSLKVFAYCLRLAEFTEREPPVLSIIKVS